MSEPRQLCTMRVGPYLFGVDVSRIQEVIGHQPTTLVPLAPSVVGGLMNLRGQILTAVDLRSRFNLPGRAASEDGEPAESTNVVVQTSSGPVSLLVDAIGEVLEVDERQRESTPSTVDENTRRLVTSVYKFDGALLLELDVDRAVYLTEHVLQHLVGAR